MFNFKKKSAERQAEKMKQMMEHHKTNKIVPMSITTAEELDLILTRFIPADDLEYRANAARNFLRCAKVAEAPKEFREARPLLEQIASEQGVTPGEFYSPGVISNLSMLRIFIPPATTAEEAKLSAYFERALLIMECLGTHGFVTEFFIAYCLDWFLGIESWEFAVGYAAHYAQRAARLRPEGALTRTEWNRIRNRFFSLRGPKNIDHAFRAHCAARGDTQVVFERPF